jgi:tRNA/rRNA methyltransferase
MQIDVAVMEPKYQINLGYIARISKNFGVKRLILINPRCNYNGKEAIKYSKHAVDLLKSATIYHSMAALKAKLIIGTTGIWHKTDKSFYNVYDIGRIHKIIKRIEPKEKIIIILGRDDTGLSKEELRQCDATISINTNKEYPILNISHALAIILNTLSNLSTKAIKKEIYADEEIQNRVHELFGRIVDSNKRIRDKSSVKMAFRHVVRRSVPTRKEINALAIALSPYKSEKKPKKQK